MGVKEERCSGCKYWTHGECRATPPRVHVEIYPVLPLGDRMPETVFVTKWPQTSASDWCGWFFPKVQE